MGAKPRREDDMLELERTLAIAAAIGLGAVSMAAPAAPISSTLSLTAFAQAGPESATDTQSASWTTPLQPLSVSVRARANDVVGEGYAEAFGSAQATWAADGLSGNVTFTIGWDTANGYASAVDLRGSGGDWRYTFVADTDGVFSIDYSVTASGNSFGLWGWFVRWDGLGGDILTTLDAFNPSLVGSASRPLTAGQTYTIALQNNANLSGPDGLFSSASMDGLFNWRIVPTVNQVSEPSALALLLTCALALAWVHRHRRATSAAG